MTESKLFSPRALEPALMSQDVVQPPASAAEFAALFKALSEPVRLRILYMMLQRGELCVCDIVDSLALSQSVVSRHLAYLRNNGLVSTRREGVWVYYELIQSSSFVSSLLALFGEAGANADDLQQDLARVVANNGSGCC
ncbi:MAG: ArsR/SmtB family transcription factor [Cellvibrionaceae bacterium]